MLWLSQQKTIYSEILPWKLLTEGFQYKGERVVLIGAQGIWTPRQLDYPISIATSIKGVYDDKETDQGIFEYAYRGTDPEFSVNLKAAEAGRLNLPMIYFKAVKKGWYYPFYPVFIRNASPDQLKFHVEIDPYVLDNLSNSQQLIQDQYNQKMDIRNYGMTLSKIRYHQSKFRMDILDAYDNRCSVCRLHHPELLDAAHIIPDGEPDGVAEVYNGLSLCKIHHAAYDENILGINPDYEIHIQQRILEEKDGPMLHYGLQEMDGARIILPGQKQDYPDRERLARRWEGFRMAG